MGLRKGSYGQYCPISRAVEVLGERWALLIVRDLLCGHSRFNDLARGNPGLSRSLLAKRLRQLERAGVVERVEGGYHLTAAGLDLRAVVFGLGEWGARWQFGEPRGDELDPELLLWWAHDRLDFVVMADLPTLYQVWLGRIDLRAAVRDGEVELLGPAALTRLLPEVFLLSPVADLVAAAT